MSHSMFSVAGVDTSSFGLVGMTAFWISEGDSAVSSVGLQLCERSDVALRTDVAVHVIRIVHVHSDPVDLALLLLFYVRTRMLLRRAGYHGFSAGRGVDPAGGSPGGG
ncbi:hypothetical protein F511_32562 [Dorcoceras hygrometricum]|uniref:Uncharacterized protein n=1 Tax=Dorcoceras hygrometricum TaxID=472368 RepID=A0A2Z7C6E0_9LAMI|nr:hypothetical protein F511_32562 [Dorcoceras hygrometricum]